MCHLSGKKFLGLEFVRKHIFNNYSEKVEEIKVDSEYFNNYLKDPKRPQSPEYPKNNKPLKEPLLQENYGFPVFDPAG